MLDKVIAAGWHVVRTAATQVREKRDVLWRERASDTCRLAARTAQTHPEGFTTTPPKNYAAAQQEYAAARREWAAHGPTLLGLLSALIVARETRASVRSPASSMKLRRRRSTGVSGKPTRSTGDCNWRCGQSRAW